MTAGQAIKQLEKQLGDVSDTPRFEAEQLMAFVLGKRRIYPRDRERELDAAALDSLNKLAERRLSGEPLQYVLGSWEFMGLTFIVRPCALIPRQDTETLVEAALELIGERGYRTALDICTGTGCIAISLRRFGGLERVSASDISAECAELAEENAKLNDAEVDISVRDLFEGHGRYDIITANPPYINKKDMEALQPEVRREPRLALYGGEDGLDFYRRIAADWRAHITPGGAMLLEVGAGQADEVRKMFSGLATETVRDLCGIERVVIVFDEREA